MRIHKYNTILKLDHRPNQIYWGQLENNGTDVHFTSEKHKDTSNGTWFQAMANQIPEEEKLQYSDVCLNTSQVTLEKGRERISK